VRPPSFGTVEAFGFCRRSQADQANGGCAGFHRELQLPVGAELYALQGGPYLANGGVGVGAPRLMAGGVGQSLVQRCRAGRMRDVSGRRVGALNR